MEEKNLTYKSPTLTNITLQSIMKEEMKKQVDDYLRKTIFKYTALVLQDFMPDARTSWNSFVDMTKEAYKKHGFSVLKELLGRLSYSTIQSLSLKSGIDGVESAEPIIRKVALCLIDDLSYIPKDADRLSLASSAAQYIKGTLIPIAISTRYYTFTDYIDPSVSNKGEFIELTSVDMYDRSDDGAFYTIKLNGDIPKNKTTKVGCYLGWSKTETNYDMSSLRSLEDETFLKSIKTLDREELGALILPESVFERLKGYALEIGNEPLISEISYEMLLDVEKGLVKSVCNKLEAYKKISGSDICSFDWVSFFPEDDELVMSKDVSSEDVSVAHIIDLFSETFSKGYDVNVGKTSFVAETHLTILYELMTSIHEVMSSVFRVSPRKKKSFNLNNRYLSPIMSWAVETNVRVHISGSSTSCAFHPGRVANDPFTLVIDSVVHSTPKPYR